VPKLKTKYLVLGLTDQDINNHVVTFDINYVVLGKHLDTFEDILDAEHCAKNNAPNFEFGCTITTIFIYE
jgi:hypothetical protein